MVLFLCSIDLDAFLDSPLSATTVSRAYKIGEAGEVVHRHVASFVDVRRNCVRSRGGRPAVNGS